MSAPESERARLAQLAWPRRRLGEALAALAERARLVAPGRSAPAEPPPALAVEAWLAHAAAELGLEAEPVSVSFRDAAAAPRRAGPALLELAADRDGRADEAAVAGADEALFLALLGARGRSCRVLRPDGRVQRVRAEQLRDALEEPARRVILGELERLCAAAGIGARRRARASAAMARQRLADQPLARVWLVRGAVGTATQRALRQAGLGRLGLGLLLAHAARYALWILSWWLLGKGALQGRIDGGWLVAWALVLATMVPLALLDLEQAGLFCARFGALLRRRLVAGALRLEPEELRHRGLGQLLGEALEADGIEQAGVGGAYLAATALLELVAAFLLLAFAAREPAAALALAAWSSVALGLVRRALAARRAWTARRLALSDVAIERMVGHRTLVAQERPERWNAGEDTALSEYHALSRTLDRACVLLEALVPRGWLALGLLSLAPAFARSSWDAGRVGVALGGVLLAYLAFRALAQGAPRAVGAWVAWERLGPLWRAASRPIERGDALFAGARDAPPDGRPLVEAQGLVHRPAGRAQAVLREAELCVRAGDRIHLAGPSGGGKSTLAAILAGLRVPESGLVLQGGLDRATLGEHAWRRRAVLAPQFHENHVLMAPLLFNALLGRAWPPSEADVAECGEVLAGLGLAELIERMPGGLAQLVGESGWQLSHGEQSRPFIARALLQDADLVLLDECFAALDPGTLLRTLAYVERRARTLLVIAHE